MCFWQSKYSERGCSASAGHRHLSHRKHLNQDCARAIMQQFKNRPCIEQNNFTKYLVSENLYVSPRSQCFRICRILTNVFVIG